MKWSSLARRLHDRLMKNGLVCKGQRLILALSGGLDSMVLLHLMLELQPFWKWELIAGHINHGLRPGADEKESLFCRSIAEKNGLAYLERELRLHGGKREHVSEDAARRRRYEVFESWVKEMHADALLTAHHAGDQAETLLYRMMTGSGLQGLRGIPEKRGVYRRPLLGFTRQELEAYAGQQGLEYMDDASNRDRRYARNKIRHNLLPFMRNIGIPGVEKRLADAASNVEEAGEALRFYVDDLKRTALWTTDSEIRILDKAFQKAPAYIQRVFLQELFENMEKGIRISRIQADQLRRFIRESEPGAATNLRGINILKERDGFLLNPQRAAFPELSFVCGPVDRIDASFPGPFGVELLPAAQCAEYRKAGQACFSEALAGKTLTLRNWQPGDRMTLFGSGSTKKVSDILKDEKIAPAVKAAYPVLLLGRDILWLPGLKRSALFTVNGKDKQMVLITCQYIRRSI